LAGLIFLILIGWGSPAKLVALGIYGVALVLLFAASASYHLATARPGVLAALRRLDHAAIFLLIAGTYTPFCMLMFEGFWRWGLLALVWSLAIVGVAIKMLIMNAPRWLSAGIYLVLGWLCMAAIKEMLRVLPSGALAWLAIGGLIYTLGAVVYMTKALDFWPGKFGFHEVWHLFVLLAAAAHFVAISGYVAPAVP
jgi:hemolysin III